MGPLCYSSVFSANKRGCAASFEVSSKAQGAHRRFSRVESKIRGNGALNAEHPHSPSPWVCNTPALLLLRLPKRSQTRRSWFKPGHLSDLWTLNSREEVQHNHAAVSVVPKVKQSFLSWLCSELCQQRNLGLNFGAWIPPS